MVAPPGLRKSTDLTALDSSLTRSRVRAGTQQLHLEPWDGRGKDHKPDWVQRLTFNRVNMGGDDGVLPGSSMYQKESERRKHITNKNARTTNPAGKLVDDWTRNKKHDERLKFVRQRMYLRKNRRATRTKVKGIAHAQKKADNSRIFNKTCQQLRYLEVLQAVEDRVINNSYLTKGMITSTL